MKYKDIDYFNEISYWWTTSEPVSTADQMTLQLITVLHVDYG